MTKFCKAVAGISSDIGTDPTKGGNTAKVASSLRKAAKSAPANVKSRALDHGRLLRCDHRREEQPRRRSPSSWRRTEPSTARPSRRSRPTTPRTARASADAPLDFGRAHVVQLARHRLGESWNEQHRRDERRDPADRDGRSETTHRVAELGRDHESHRRTGHSRDEEETVRRPARLGREQLGVEGAERQAGAGRGDDGDRRVRPRAGRRRSRRRTPSGTRWRAASRRRRPGGGRGSR